MRVQIEAKGHARTAAKQARAAAFARHGSTAALRLAEQGLAFSGAGSHAIVSGFRAIGDEIDPLPLLTKLDADGAWKPGDPTKTTLWGIGEPLPSASYVEPGVLLVPLLAFDPMGYRLGYGGGFYDRTLAKLREHQPVIAIGLAFDEQQVAAVPHVEYDQRLDWVLTPSGPLRTK
jgi:5-formyltetrahydrofolate cyclo-ligase